MDVALAHLAVEGSVFEMSAFGAADFGNQAPVSGIRWGIRQGHADQREEIGHAGA
ncbi:Uncharacterised protein [Mycobacteroides abscessus subsp. abscessus]|nr:Uncharacterised protein [Mycobacteroides abscessus subsp. abscessus]